MLGWLRDIFRVTLNIVETFLRIAFSVVCKESHLGEELIRSQINTVYIISDTNYKNCNSRK
jgi:hypothetical protein